MTRRQPSNISLQRVLLATTTRLHITNSHVVTIKYHMHYPIFMACTGGAVISLTSYPYTVCTRVSCQAVSPTNGLGTRLHQGKPVHVNNHEVTTKDISGVHRGIFRKLSDWSSSVCLDWPYTALTKIIAQCKRN